MIMAGWPYENKFALFHPDRHPLAPINWEYLG